ncbi:MAG: anti-sigma factor [Actinomycetota bacterium]|nr:anti-sigma factor [Acidimicrobiia bacterium]MDQ3469029.1 anti-sigma factor [Actinomycetota bacterium]
MDQQRIEDLLGAYALDAVDDEERRLVEAYLETDPRARAEVQAHREAAAMLSAGSPPPPPAVWARIVAAIDVSAPPPGPRLATVLPASRRNRWTGPVLAAAAAAVVVAGAVVVASIRSDDDPGDARPPAGAVEQAYGEAWADPDGRRARLISEEVAFAADAVVGMDGIGFVSANSLPTLPSEETYQLWGVYGDGDVISLGVIGNRPGIEPFTATGDIGAIVITQERAGGVVSSTSGALLAGDLG